jgi:plasmid stability protein
MTIRNVPDGLHERLKQRAARNRRSLSSELLVILENAVGPSTQEKRQMHEEIAANPSRPPLADDPQTLKQKYREGLE